MGVLKVKVGSEWVPIGVSDTGAATPWVAVTFQNGWTNEGGSIQPVQYRKIGDIVYLRGSMKPGTIGAIAFTLPIGFRPPLQLRTIAFGFTPTTIVRADVYPNGEYYPYDGASQTQFRIVDMQFSTIA